MCSPYCPCPIDLDFEMWDEGLLNLWGRTKEENATNGYTPMVYAPDWSVASFNNYGQCYDMIEKRPDFLFREKIDSGILDFMKSIESEFDCNGVCYTGLFYFFKPIYSGPPRKTCFEGIKSFFSMRFLQLGIIIGASFVLVFVTFFTSCSLCCKSSGGDDSDEEEEEEEMKEVIGPDGKKTMVKTGKKIKKKKGKDIEIKFVDTGVASIDAFCKTVQEFLDTFKTLSGTLGEQKVKFIEAAGFTEKKNATVKQAFEGMLYAMIVACNGSFDDLEFSLTDESPFFTIGSKSLEGTLTAMNECFIGYIKALFDAATV